MTISAKSQSAPLPERRHKSLQLADVTTNDGDGTFIGIASAVNVIDRHGEFIEPGAFDETLRSKGQQYPLLWQHDPGDPIGIINLSVDVHSGNLLAQGELNLDTQRGREAYALLKQGAVAALSIGFNIPEGAAVWDQNAGILRIHAVDLWEVSVVTFSANPAAEILEVKSQLLDAVKAGKVLSTANRSKIEAAIEALQAVLDADTPPSEQVQKESVGPIIETVELDTVKRLIDDMRQTLTGRIKTDG